MPSSGLSEAIVGEYQRYLLIVEDGAAIPDGEDIGRGVAPDTTQVIASAAAHGTPGAAVVVEDGATNSPRRRHLSCNCPRHHVDLRCRRSWRSTHCHRSGGWCHYLRRRRHRRRNCPRHHTGDWLCCWSWCSRHCHRSGGWCHYLRRRRHRRRNCPRHYTGNC